MFIYKFYCINYSNYMKKKMIHNFSNYKLLTITLDP